MHLVSRNPDNRGYCRLSWPSLACMCTWPKTQLVHLIPLCQVSSPRIRYTTIWQFQVFTFPFFCPGWVNYYSEGTVFIMGLRSSDIFKVFQCGDRLYTSESGVYRRQILTYKDDPRTEKVKSTGVWCADQA